MSLFFPMFSSCFSLFFPFLDFLFCFLPCCFRFRFWNGIYFCFYVSFIFPLFSPMFSSCFSFFSFSCYSLLFSSLLVPFSLLKRIKIFVFILPVFCLCSSQCFLVVFRCFFLFLIFSFVFFLVGPVFAFETAYIFVFILPVFCLCFPQCFLVVFCFFSFSGFSLLFSSLLVPFSLLKRLIFLFLSFLYFVFVLPNVF